MPPPGTPRSTTPHPATLTLPRILCLHGGGVNAAIFRNQLRSFLTHPQLLTRFRFVFVDAPFLCDEGVGVGVVYANWGPFRRWFRWLPSHEEIDIETAHQELLETINQAMEGDEGTGAWVGLLGFSQGAKLACSMLYQQQLDKLHPSTSKSPTSNGSEKSASDDNHSTSNWTFQFGIILAGRSPLASLTPPPPTSQFYPHYPWLQSPSLLPSSANPSALSDHPEMRLTYPTIHVHGLLDEGLQLHRQCVEEYCAPGTTTVVEWEGAHRVPVKRGDVENVVRAIVEVADEYEV